MSTISDGGRITDRRLLIELGWSAAVRLDFVVREPGVLLARPSASGPVSIAATGYLRLPRHLLHQVGLRPGDRVLLLSRREGREMSIYPPAAIASTFGDQSPCLDG
jgi:hypothetical protein